jgi:hypothetical protein
MYATCLSCSASLGRNEALEHFPVGSRVAFDAWKGRLWAVCSRCGRWNLAPLEERWEPVEEAERLFRDTHTRVQSENIGLARLRDGTRLVRVGRALPGELAAWRYGGQLVSRRNRRLAWGAATGLGAGALLAGAPLLASAGASLFLVQLGVQSYVTVQLRRQTRRVVHRIDAAHSPTGEELVIRAMHLHDAGLTTGADGDVAVRLPPASMLHPWRMAAPGWMPRGAEPFILSGREAQRVLARSLTDYNQGGARRNDIEHAVAALADAGGAAAFARALAERGAAIARPQRFPLARLQPAKSPQRGGPPALDRVTALALEMALHEEAERRALEGELAELEAAWREAEEIARIADEL